ncbi:MAG TPA: CBS domain-containing protein [Dehalococcoidia bacterium]|nr:CBS domain-containing protein [Dehalococcoidia bacterium]
MKAKDMMSVPVTEVFESATVQRAAQIMAAHRAGILLVTDEGGHMKGVVTDRDLLLRSVAVELDPAHVTVGECMSGPDSPGGQLVTVKPDDDLEDVVAVMHKAGVHRVVVSADGRRAVGLLSFDEIASDLKRYLGEFLSVASRYHKL